MPKPVLRKLLILWAMLLIGQFLLAAYQVYKNMTFGGMPALNAFMRIEPVMAMLSLMLFLITYLQYKSRP